MKNVVEEMENEIVLMYNMDLSSFKRIVESSTELKQIKGVKYTAFCCKFFSRNNILINLERLKSQKKIIANHEVTDLEKEEVVNFFKNNRILLEDGLVTIAIRRKVKEEFDFNNYVSNNRFCDMLEDNEFEDINLDRTYKNYVKK